MEVKAVQEENKVKWEKGTSHGRKDHDYLMREYGRCYHCELAEERGIEIVILPKEEINEMVRESRR